MKICSVSENSFLSITQVLTRSKRQTEPPLKVLADLKSLNTKIVQVINDAGIKVVRDGQKELEKIKIC